jgi:uncharacterized protein YhjY with autotransporter beta-barrel domain
VFIKSYRMIGPATTLVALQASFLAPALAQLPPPPANATPLQQTMFSAVANMCVNALDGHTFKAAPVNDLHDQCHAIAGAALVNGAGSAAPTSALGALQQVSGNEISTQGSLATRVSAGQFGNITGRLNALRLGSSSSFMQGASAREISTPSGGSSFAAAAPQVFYFDRSVADLDAQGDGSSQAGLLPVGNFQRSGTLMPTNYSSDGLLRVAQADSPGSARSSGYAGPSAGLPNPWGFFVQGSYNSGRHDQTNNEDPFDFHASSVTAGIDYNFGTAVLGASVGYDDFDAGLRSSGTTVSGGSARVAATSGSLYGAWFGQNWNFNGIATYGKLTTQLSRDVKYTATYANGFDPQNIPNATDQCSATTCSVTVDRVLQGNPAGRSFAIGATAGYQYSVSSWDIDPSLSLNYRRASFDSFAENDPNLASDGLALTFGDQTVESLRSILGVEVSRPVSVSFGVLTPIVRVEWDHEYKTAVRTISAHYSYDPSCNNGVCDSSFALPTDAPSGNYGVAGAGISVTLARRVQAFVFDEALFGYSNYHSNSITLGVRAQL